MKAVYIERNGALDAVQFGDLPDPEPGPGQVILEVQAAALNHLDIWVRKGRPGAAPLFPHVLGSDATGQIVEVGEGVDPACLGREVILNPGLNPVEDEWTRRGQQSESAAYSIVGLGGPGAFAECVAVSAAKLEPRPAHLSVEEAAALPLAYLTAWRMLMTRCALQPGETVLIHGIGGGVALAALQLVKLAGAEAIVTSSSQAKLDRARALGAAHGIRYAGGASVAAAVREATGGRGVDIAFDTVGASTWPINFEAVRRGGRIVHCGVTTGAEVTANISALYWNHLTVMGSTMGSDEDFRQLVAAVRTAQLHPIVDSVYPLAEAKQAMARMENGEQFGKIVLKV